MSILKFYTDTHIDKQVAIQLRQKGVDVIRCEDVGLAEADDETHLRYAAEHQIALITKDAGFRLRHFNWIGQGRTHYGIFFCSNRQAASIGQIVNICAAYAELLEQGAGTLADVQNEFFDITQEMV